MQFVALNIAWYLMLGNRSRYTKVTQTIIW